MRTSLSVTFRVPDEILPRPDFIPGLILEQSTPAGSRRSKLDLERADVKIGLVTKLDLVRELAARLYGGTGAEVDCGFQDGEFVTAILVYPYYPEMAYEITASHGHLSGAIISEVEVDEKIEFSLSNVATTRYPVQDLISIDPGPIGYCWDAQGHIVQPFPDILWDGTSIYLDQKVYATVRIKYYTIRHARILRIPSRNSVANSFQSMIIANWTGGIKMLSLVTPATSYGGDNGCSSRPLSSILLDIPPEKIAPPEGTGVYHEINIDYCTQTIEK